MEEILNLRLLGSIHGMTKEQWESFPHLSANAGQYQRQNIGVHYAMGTITGSCALTCA